MYASRFNEEETAALVSLLMAQRAEHARELLGLAGLRKSGTKEEIEERIVEAIKDGNIPIDDVVAILDKIEAWGRQHVFLYSAPDKVPAHLRSKSGLQSALDNAGWNVSVNSAATLALPKIKTVRLVNLTSERLRIEWVEARDWTERLPSLDYIDTVSEQEVVFQACRKRQQRAISAFEWNFMAQTGELFIHRLPSGTKYDKEEEAFRALLKPIVDLDTFEFLGIKRALSKVKEAPGVRERKTNYVAANNSKISLQSAGRASTVGAEPELKEVGDLIKRSRKFGAAFLNCFWEKDGKLGQEVHTHIDSFDSKVGFLGQCSEESVRYVLSRIRKAAG